MTCDKTQMTPELCAATCIGANADKGLEVVAIAVEYSVECYCATTFPVLPTPAASGCDMKCGGAPAKICGNYAIQC